MSRLNIDRQNKLEPKRMEYAENAIRRLGLEIIYSDAKVLKFNFNGNLITLYPYSGWFSGKGIVQGRGIAKLLQQLK